MSLALVGYLDHMMVADEGLLLVLVGLVITLNNLLLSIGLRRCLCGSWWCAHYSRYLQNWSGNFGIHCGRSP